MGRVEGKIALITGAARGQGRSHALRLAQEGADIIALDICDQIDSVPYGMGTSDDLAETVRQIEALDRRIVASQADVRDYGSVKAAIDAGVAQLGGIDIVSANAGIFSYASLDELPEQQWQDMIDVNLTGVWHTVKAAVPHLRAGGKGGSIILTSSVAGIRSGQHIGHYAAAKHGVIGLMKTFALELGAESIRVNSVHPTSVNTDMIMNQATYDLFAPDLPPEERTKENVAPRMGAGNILPTPWVEAVDISNAVLFLASDESRFITGVQLPIDAGALIS
ncbi:mycofactocin-coupled SDR family oxidoreductase [Subtercola endophyticus]|uniref:mycofactocin-coupled SDR family oxidoreductase n=1 Tax=Subtercola endophyticus TaxID=2895559 RepID=UPI001E2AD432|nr:mycofactocin-coupled SDR family oxidoreductase [Subtercola endophyticus]UFS58761.1 mycofactocin-coupled SDR family oxidoreductase [Subtercola endophyticus]